MTTQETYNQNQAQGQFGVANVPFHFHNGQDSNKIDFVDLKNRSMVLSYTLFGATPQTAGNYSSFFIAPYAMTVTQIQEVHTVTNGGALTLYVEKLTGTTAPASGINLMANTFNLNATANINQTAKLSPTVTVIQLNAGDRLGLVKTGTLTNIANLTVTLILNY